MDDMISRRAAIDAICKDGTQRERQGQYSMTMVDRKYRDIEILEALPSAQPGWIPCSERLPKLNGYYLTTIKWGEDFYEVDVYEYDSYYKEWNEGEYFGGTVVAWQPLSTPYREGGQDNG